VTQPGLVGAALLFWGWHTGLLPLATVLAVVLEGARFVRLRWDLAPREQNRVADLSTLLFLALGVYLAVTAGITDAAMLTLQWLPLSLTPLLAVQCWSSTGRTSLTTLFWSRRHASETAAAGRATTVDLAPIYAGMAVLSASVPNHRGLDFYAGACVIAALALWPGRSIAYRRLTWAIAFTLAMVLGFAGHVGLNALQALVEQVTSDLFARVPDLDVDPYRAFTSLGTVGALKAADRIVLRVDAGAGLPPRLLREATYTTYRGRSWLSGSAEFSPVEPSGTPPRWMLVERAGAGTERSGTRRVDVAGSLKRGRGVLPLPGGAVAVDGLREGRIGRSPLGVVRVDGGKALDYAAEFVPDAVFATEPTSADLRLPEEEAAVLRRTADALGLAGRGPHGIVRAVEDHFRGHFRYSTYLERGEPGATPLEDFLERSRAGHCEYFATTATLLLRAAGVPARYATGYAVQEWSRLEQRWVVRARHGHAWTLVWLDGGWRELDTTPPAWVTADGADAKMWEPFTDVWSWLAFRASRLFDGGTAWLAEYGWWLLVPMVAWLAWRLAPRRGGTRTRLGAGDAAPAALPGADSEFYAIERTLAARGLGRRGDEPVGVWLARVERAVPEAGAVRQLAALHQRYRFDPHGLDADDRRALRDGVDAWLASGVER
jgi:transglutaminase-like putative cysteine protease